MEYKEDWQRVQQWYQAWLAGEELPRPLIQVTAPRRATDGPSGWTGWNFVHDLDNPDAAIEAFEQHCRLTYFGGEAFPNLWINMGPGCLSAYLGCRVCIRPETVWFEDLAMDWQEILSARIQPDNLWWRKTVEFTRIAAERSAGRWVVGMTDLNAVLNILANPRGTERLLTATIEHPGEAKQAARHITELWFGCFDDLYEITQRHQRGISNWMGIWFPGRGTDVQCDFSAMISPAMFEEFVVPHLQEQCRRLEHTIYHMDGPGQIPHLDLLLDIPELDGIQWVPGAGNPSTGSPKWFDMYRRIQSRGKLLVLQGMDKADVQRVIEELDPRGLLIGTVCDSEEEARDLLKQAERWSRRGTVRPG